MTFLPFVRESRDIKGAAKPAATVAAPKPAAVASSETPPPAPAPSPTLAACAAPALSPEGEALKTKIEACGEEIRVKKAAKAGKEEIKALVDQLLALKTSFTEATGLVFGPPMVAASATPIPSKEAKKTKEVVPKKEAAANSAPSLAAQPPAIPVEPPASVVAAVPRRTRISLPTPSSVWKQEAVDMARLEEQLRTHSYVTGAQPSAEDVRVVCVLASGETDVERLLAYCGSKPFPGSPQVSRWLRSMSAFSAEELGTLN